MDETDPDDEIVVVIVTRTGGLAGLRKAWRAEPRPDEAPLFVDLISQCPWDEPAPDGAGADRYTWSIAARCGSEEREADVPDAGLTGPWRDLVDAVRDWQAPGD
ncbi:protealysin inhibitor emfourin [Microbacterium sp.]|uniref:protealysin inhibitor emfourin n=1 Tax=Microbacterium sp. TaxID=51671 RepID=UPI003F6E8A30